MANEEAREAQAWLADLVVSTPISTEAALIAFKHGVAEGIRQAREAVADVLEDGWWDDGGSRGAGAAAGIRVAAAAIDALGDDDTRG